MATKKTTTKKEATTTVQTARVLIRPRVTEKAANASTHNTYVFTVVPTATRSEVAKAFKAQYGHMPVRVNIVNVRPEAIIRRTGRGMTKRMKKAYITLAKGVTVAIQ